MPAGRDRHWSAVRRHTPGQTSAGHRHGHKLLPDNAGLGPLDGGGVILMSDIIFIFFGEIHASVAI